MQPNPVAEPCTFELQNIWFENHSLRRFSARRSYNSEMCAKASAATCLWLTTPHPTRFTRTHLPPRLRFY